VLVGPYPPCTQTSAAATGIFEGGVGHPTSHFEVETSPELEKSKHDNQMLLATMGCN
jgi:hypothetical protein